MSSVDIQIIGLRIYVVVTVSCLSPSCRLSCGDVVFVNFFCVLLQYLEPPCPPPYEYTYRYYFVLH